VLGLLALPLIWHSKSEAEGARRGVALAAPVARIRPLILDTYKHLAQRPIHAALQPVLSFFTVVFLLRFFMSQTKENPDSVAADLGVQGIEALPSKITRYSKAKLGALDVVDYIDTMPKHKTLARRIRTCGDYLVFRHYFTVDQVRLHGATLCMKHLLCPLCAIRRGAKALKSYLARWECIQAENPSYRAFLVTLTVKNGDDLAERMAHLQKSQRELWKRRQRGRGSVLDCVKGAVWSYEFKRGQGSKTWHPHLHMIAVGETAPDKFALSAEWREITGDSFIVDVRPISQADPVSGFLEVFKYAVKFSSQSPKDTWDCFLAFSGKRLLCSSGCFIGVEIPESLVDDELDDLPFRTLFYRFLGVGYSLSSSPVG
jgi:hypothetical protein